MSNEVKHILTDDINILLKTIAEEEGFISYEIKINGGSVKGDGYTSIIKWVRLDGEDKERKDKVLNLVVKSASAGEAFRNTIPIAACFEKELYMYDKVFSAFKAFEIQRGLSPSHFGPKFYKGSVLPGHEALILENLKENGYILHNKKLPMNQKHVDLVITKYARLHALSLVMRDQEKDKFEKLTTPLLDGLLIKFLKEHFLDSIIYRSTKVLESLNREEDEEVREIYRKFIDDIPNFLDQLLCDEVDEYSVILQADCWCNNMMFKYHDPRELNEPSAVRLFDYQVSIVASPAFDLCYFYYVCSCKEALDKLEHYMQLYHKNLSSYILRLGGKANNLYPYSVLEKHWKKYARFGLIMATIAIHAMLSEKDEIIDFNEIADSKGTISSAFSYEIASVEKYNNRIRNIILHFYENHLF